MSGVDKLNAAQQSAVNAPLHPILVLAGPGTGKTKVLIERIAHLNTKTVISAEQILALTFTNKAAGELRDRLQRLIGINAESVTASTFHAFALSVVRNYADRCGLKPFFSVCDRDYQLKLVINLCRPYIPERVEDKARGILLAFSNHILKESKMSKFLHERFEEYTSYLHEHNLIDFDQLIYRSKELIQKNEDVRSQYKHRYTAILVDEFQDTDPLQYDILYLLAEEHQNIFVVADDDQSIYSWRGAHPENIRLFMKDFAVKDPIILEINYRSRTEIIDSAGKILTKTNRIQADKKIISSQEGHAELELIMCASESEEAEFIHKKITQWIKSGANYSDIALIYPFHHIGESLERLFIKNRLPYQMAHGRSILDHPQIRKIILYLRLIRDSNDVIALEALTQNELGTSIYNHIKDNSLKKKIGFRQSLHFYYSKSASQLTRDTKIRIKEFVTEIANLVNLKNFYTFPRLFDEILSISDSYYSTALHTYQDEIEPVDDLVHNAELGDPLPDTIFVYHPDERISYLACDLISEILKIKCNELLDTSVSLPDRSAIIKLKPFECQGKELTEINVYDLLNTYREGSVTALFKFLQRYLSKYQQQRIENYVILDLETTDSDPHFCGVVEIAAIKILDQQIVGNLQTLIKPDRPISKGAQDVHHITAVDVQHAPDLEHFWPEFISFIGNSPIIAHNGYGFDFIILDRYAKKVDGTRLPNIRVDTLALARKRYPGQSNSIDALMDRFGLDMTDGSRHRAYDDVKILQKIFNFLENEREIQRKRLSLESFLDRVALANVIENKLSLPEDRIFFISGARKLSSPYSKIQSKLCKKFELDDKLLSEQIVTKTKQLAPDIKEYRIDEHILAKIRTIAAEFITDPIDEAIAKFLSVVALSNPQDQLENINAVSLLTYHAAKGLEFDKVILVGLEKDNMPGFHAFREDPNDDRPVSQKVQEQRRLFYVGMTRAKSELVLTAVKNRGGWDRDSSPFLKDISIPVSNVYGL
jgi:DNA polymerase III epsilon subunit family exonuclease